MIVNRPIRFQGTPEQAAANYRTHDWIVYDIEEPRECGRCCAREYHAAASYPCGVEPPRETVEVGS